MKKCQTIPLPLLEVSGCLIEKPECEYAYQFGFSFVCRHPDHTKFHAHLAGTLTSGEVLELYDTLRRKRRDKFLENLDETRRSYFCRQTDFFGQTPT